MYHCVSYNDLYIYIYKIGNFDKNKKVTWGLISYINDI